MGRQTPSRGMQPPALRKDARAKRAKTTINKDVPALLKAYPRARRGIDTSELFHGVSDPVENSDNRITGSVESEARQSQTEQHHDEESLHSRVKVQVADTLQSAMLLHTNKEQQRSKVRIGILNMASPLRPGGGFLNGATSQEESLCMRTTLYPALKEEFYRLPEVGGIYTPDVLVFRSWDEDATDLHKNKRFFVDVVSSGMLRFPDVTEEEDAANRRFASAKDRILVERKMKAIIRICETKNIGQMILGAWGCGAYGNPVDEVAQAWRKVLEVITPKSSDKQIEFVFAIKSPSMAQAFAEELGVDVETLEGDTRRQKEFQETESLEEQQRLELEEKIIQLESQITQTRNPDVQDRLRTVLKTLNDQFQLLVETNS